MAVCVQDNLQFICYIFLVFHYYYIKRIENMNYKNTQINCSSSIQKITEKENRRQFESISKENIQTSRKVESIVLSKNTFNFEEINSKNGQQNTSRIHGKMGTKRMGGKVVLVKQKDKMERKEINVSKFGKKQKYNIEFQNKKIMNDECKMANGLSIKSYQFQEKTDNNDPQDNEDGSSLSSKQQQKSSFMAHSPANQKHSQEQDTFKELKRKMMAENELFKNKKQQQNCFYATLKRKLKIQMMKIEDKQDYDRFNFTIQGCNANMHIKTNVRLLSENQRHRPQTALNISKMDACSKNSKKRPLSERTKSYQTLQKNNSVNHLKNKTLQMLNPKRSERHTANQRLAHSRNLSQNIVIQSYQQSLTKRGRHVRNQSQDSSKMNKILDECDNYSGQHQILKDNMKIFQFYCKKVDDRFKRVSHQLEIVQNFQID